MTLAEKIRKLRGYMPASELARQVGVSRGTVHGWESGDTKPGADHILPLSRALNVTVEILLDDEKEVA